jgi:hypothetical protein
VCRGNDCKASEELLFVRNSGNDYTAKLSACDDIDHSQIPDCLSCSNIRGDYITVHRECVNPTSYCNNPAGDFDSPPMTSCYAGSDHIANSIDIYNNATMMMLVL